MKYLASILCGLFSGLAGAHLSLGYLTMFTENMVRVARIHCGRVRDFWNVESTKSVFGGAAVRLYRCARFACAIVQRVLKPDLARAVSGYGGDDGLRGLARRTEKKTFGKAGKIVNLNRLSFV